DASAHNGWLSSPILPKTADRPFVYANWACGRTLVASTNSAAVSALIGIPCELVHQCRRRQRFRRVLRVDSAHICPTSCHNRPFASRQPTFLSCVGR
ncbi:hypothetical protein DIPPA_10113, partial [Diplonema papillatum]